MTKSIRFTILSGIVFYSTMTLATESIAQVVEFSGPRAYKPDVALRLLFTGSPGAGNISSAFMIHYDKYTEEERHYLLNGVERVASGIAIQEEPGFSRALRESFGILKAIGSRPEVVHSSDWAITDRLFRIYRTSDNDASKWGAVLALSHMFEHSPRHSTEILDLYIHFATAKRGIEPVSPYTAIRQLGIMGEAGRQTLQYLHENELVQDLEARMFLATLARRGYPDQRIR